MRKYELNPSLAELLTEEEKEKIFDEKKQILMKKIRNTIPKWKWDAWEKCVMQSLSGNLESNILDLALDVIKLLNDGGTTKQAMYLINHRSKRV